MDGDKGVLKAVEPTLGDSEASTWGKKLVLRVEDMGGVWNNLLSLSDDGFVKDSLECGMLPDSHDFHGSLC